MFVVGTRSVKLSEDERSWREGVYLCSNSGRCLGPPSELERWQRWDLVLNSTWYRKPVKEIENMPRLVTLKKKTGLGKKSVHAPRSPHQERYGATLVSRCFSPYSTLSSFSFVFPFCFCVVSSWVLWIQLCSLYLPLWISVLMVLL